MSTNLDIKLDRSQVSRAALTDPSDEKAYWRDQTPAARLEALELMRQVMYGYDPATDRLQRVLEVARRTPG